ncbi:interleukin-15 receptor subunit alpha isoform X2 [Pelmatolapia mariae]|uniref:interleukin-15 receptor subunit alpha isoform X2 n=1 Tax=Pelmatolapia mariae TaxID=158779 RepID=UPI002FE5249D
MALVSLAFSVCVMIVCWPQLSSSDNSCPCPEIPKLNLTNLPQQGCYNPTIRAHFRYKCKDGYLRKVGTSNLIKCEDSGTGLQWSKTKPELVCIPDPRITTTQPAKATSATSTTTTTTTESHTDISSYSISTSAITTASTAQVMQNASTVLEQGTSTQTTTHEPVMETTGKTDTMKHAMSPTRPDNTTHSALEIDAATTTAATVITVLLVIVCTAGVVLLYRRRRREHTPVNQDPEELCTLNA